MRFSEMSYPEIGDAAMNNGLVLLPIGQTEEHGLHLPTGTDTIIVDEVTRGIAEEIKDEIPVVVMDTVRYGYSVKSVARWPGTIRLSAETVMNTVAEICTSLAKMEFRKIAIINSHGNHPALLEMVSRRMADECDINVPVLSTGGLVAEALAKHAGGGEGASCHAGELETSIMLVLQPELVHTNRYTSEDRIRVINPGGSGVFWSTWRRQESKTGIYGDPTTATEEKGREFLKGIVQKACEFLRTYYRHPGISRKP